MNTDFEYECKAIVTGRPVDVVVTYEIDFPDVLIYGIFELADPENDLTQIIDESEFDRIYIEISAKVHEDMACAAETYFEGDR